MANAMMRFELVSPDGKVVLHYASKSGCSVAIQSFFKSFGLLEEALRFDPFVHHYKNKVYIPDKMGEALPDATHVGVIRDPLDRAVSSFNWFVKYAFLPDPVLSERAKAAIRLSMPEVPLDTAHHHITFEDFVLRILPDIDVETCDPHWGLQACELGEETKSFWATLSEDPDCNFPAFVCVNEDDAGKVSLPSLDSLSSTHHRKRSESHGAGGDHPSRLAHKDVFSASSPDARAFFKDRPDLVEAVKGKMARDFELFEHVLGRIRSARRFSAAAGGAEK